MQVTDIRTCIKSERENPTQQIYGRNTHCYTHTRTNTMQQICINQQTYIKSKRVVVVEEPLHLPVLFQDILQLSLSKANSSDTGSTFMLPPNHVGTWYTFILHRIYLLSLKVTIWSPFMLPTNLPSYYYLISLHITTQPPFMLPPYLHFATWSPFIVRLDLPSVFHLISILLSNLHSLCHVISLHFATWSSFIFPHYLHFATWSLFILLLGLPSCYHLISIYFATWFPCHYYPVSLHIINWSPFMLPPDLSSSYHPISLNVTTWYPAHYQ